MSRFGVSLPQSRIRKMELEDLREALRVAAFEQLDRRDVNGVQKYLEPLFAERELAGWAKEKFDIDVDPQEMVVEGARGTQPKEAADIVGLIENKAREAYARREVEYPVDELIARVAGESQRIEIPDAAQFVAMWARAKYGVTLAYEELMNADVGELREKLVELQEKFLHGGELEKEIDLIMAPEQGKTGEPSGDVVAQRFTVRFGIKMEAADLYPEPEDERLTNLDKGRKRIAYAERVDVPKTVREVVAERARGVLRQELSSLEQFILIQIFDDTWKNHLYAMDMLKSGIGLVGFAEKDPRVVYKKEGLPLLQRDDERHPGQGHGPDLPRPGAGAGEGPQRVPGDGGRPRDRRRVRGGRDAGRPGRRRGAAREPDGRGGRPAAGRGGGRAGPADRQRRPEGRPQRPVPVRERQEVQEVPRGRGGVSRRRSDTGSY
jgi:preprotein translocase subunit SecA